MNDGTLIRIKRIDVIIRKIRFAQSESGYSPFFEQAIECLKLARIQIVIDGESRDKYEAEKAEAKP